MLIIDDDNTCSYDAYWQSDSHCTCSHQTKKANNMNQEAIYMLSVVIPVVEDYALFKFKGMRPNKATEAILWLLATFTAGLNTVFLLTMKAGGVR